MRYTIAYGTDLGPAGQVKIMKMSTDSVSFDQRVVRIIVRDEGSPAYYLYIPYERILHIAEEILPT